MRTPLLGAGSAGGQSPPAEDGQSPPHGRSGRGKAPSETKPSGRQVGGGVLSVGAPQPGESGPKGKRAPRGLEGRKRRKQTPRTRKGKPVNPEGAALADHRGQLAVPTQVPRKPGAHWGSGAKPAPPQAMSTFRFHEERGAVRKRGSSATSPGRPPKPRGPRPRTPRPPRPGPAARTPE